MNLPKTSGHKKMFCLRVAMEHSTEIIKLYLNIWLMKIIQEKMAIYKHTICK